METDYDGTVLDCWKIPNGRYTVKMKQNNRSDSDNDMKNTMRLHLGAFVLSSSRRLIKIFIKKIIGFFDKNVYYTGTDSLYIEKNFGMFWTKLVYLVLVYTKVKTVINPELSSMDCSWLLK